MRQEGQHHRLRHAHDFGYASRAWFRGPCPATNPLAPMLDTICPHVIPELTLADAGYDSQHNHKRRREDLKIKSLIPATSGRPTAKLPTNKWRWLIAAMFDQET